MILTVSTRTLNAAGIIDLVTRSEYCAILTDLFYHTCYVPSEHPRGFFHPVFRRTYFDVYRINRNRFNLYQNVFSCRDRLFQLHINQALRIIDWQVFN
ncbi:hypothetical protein D3C74_469110 [compost metagenome]